MVERTLEQHLAACTRSALHLEMRDGYTLNDPDYHAWRTGHRIDLNDRSSWWRPWLQNIVDASARGVQVRRARIVSEPISSYIRYEYDITVPNVRAGEHVRWLPRRQTTDLALPGNDFWLFDEEVLLVHHFSGEGDKVGSETITDPRVVTFCLTTFEAVWERAIPHDHYQPL
ncbi:hypothetical protein GCM10010156_70270 [Planobispora rosea]|uniref:DUF6879 domain-containing protein n=1 Tax=Planobispora rosea TaxID=35762 RepID=A0A8J3WI70_PLARO|nr:DUF6879 family protein [Planobispora rosea]GGT02358.1 hypothetical protein GCM10010156_70270 [Planobispora rosea]GIH88561.1 hypothetical protein Pro02_69690 [Planobispora rosea]